MRLVRQSKQPGAGACIGPGCATAAGGSRRRWAPRRGGGKLGGLEGRMLEGEPVQLPLLWTSSPTTPRTPPVRRSVLMFQCPLPHHVLPTCPLEPSRVQVALHDHHLGSSPAGHPTNSCWMMRPAEQPPSMRGRGSWPRQRMRRPSVSTSCCCSKIGSIISSWQQRCMVCKRPLSLPRPRCASSWLPWLLASTSRLSHEGQLSFFLPPYHPLVLAGTSVAYLSVQITAAAFGGGAHTSSQAVVTSCSQPCEMMCRSCATVAAKTDSAVISLETRMHVFFFWYIALKDDTTVFRTFLSLIIFFLQGTVDSRQCEVHGDRKKL
ncbi:uncharacterized protein LOC142580214 isoform X2 [Dermacentor variabilis]|uniref:uncharacterized protein LOC142580214 isoform X2 n=1 Tax=Dermacentor variabilis TaxID=34621 RepID=UPI003F5C37A9